MVNNDVLIRQTNSKLTTSVGTVEGGDGMDGVEGGAIRI